MKVLQFGDVHAKDSSIAEIRKCCDFIAQTAEAERPDAIINTGDTTDRRDLLLDSQSAKYLFEFFQRLANVAPVVTIIGTESHDGTAAEVLRHVRGLHPVYIATTPQQYKLVAGNAPFLVSAVPAPTKKFLNSGSIEEGDQNINAAMTAVFAGLGAQAAEHPEMPHILVGHWTVSGCKISEAQDYCGKEIAISIDQMMLAQPDLICLGHIHYGQQIGDRAFYNGSIYQKDYGEMERKGFWLHEFCSGNKFAQPSRFIKTPSRRLYRVQADCTADISACMWICSCETEAAAMQGAIVRYEITCWQDEAHAVPVAEIEKATLAAGAASVDVRLIRIPRQTVRSEIVLKARTLREKLVAMAALRGEEVAESILLKADALEAMQADDLIKQVAA